MPHTRKQRPSPTQATVVPAGTPDWITPELLADTIATWQPRYGGQLTTDAALEILMDVGQLFEILGTDHG
jgi:hypothetical protein